MGLMITAKRLSLVDLRAESGDPALTISTDGAGRNVVESLVLTDTELAGFVAATAAVPDPAATPPAATIAATYPVQVVRTAGDFNLAVSAAWVDSDPSGAAPARELDIVLGGMEEGSGFCVQPAFSIGVVVGGTLLNLAVIKAGVLVRRLFPEAFGFLPWSVPTGAAKDVVAPSPRFNVAAGDLEDDGSLRVRLQHIQATTARPVSASDAFPFWLEGRGPLA